MTTEESTRSGLSATRWVTIAVSLGALAVWLIAGVGPSLSRAADIDSEIESLRSDIRADKTSIVKDAMQLTPQQAQVFWPLYREYEDAAAKLNDERIDLMKQYGAKYDNLSDSDARAIAEKSFDLEFRRADLKSRYYKKFAAKLRDVTAARFFQIEKRLDLVADVQIASALPPILARSPEAPGR